MVDSGTSPPPTRASLKAWWKQFQIRQKSNAFQAKKDNEDRETNRVFGVPLKESLRYASVQISTANKDGELYVWGYIPVVVAKCGLYLKEKATETQGIFRISGSTKRMKDLQIIFETPPRYGKSIDWNKETFTNHDVASVFRRYLVRMHEPVVPSSLYHEFRNVYRSTRKTDEIIQEYKRLIRSMPRANQYLLLYILDLLSVFARKSDKNLMTASNLAVIFRPGILAHRDHDLAPAENELSTQVLEFLIKHQDWFILDIPPLPQSSDSTTSVPRHVGRGSGASGSHVAGANAMSGTTTATVLPSQAQGGVGDLYDTDVQIEPSSEEEHDHSHNHDREHRERNGSSSTSGGWKLIHRRKRDREQEKKGGSNKINTGRRKSFVDHYHHHHTRAHSPQRKGSGSGGDILSPVNELGEDVVLGVGGGERGASVGRSRTLPSGSTKSRHASSGSDREGGEKGDRLKSSGNVLKKKKERSRPISMTTNKG